MWILKKRNVKHESNNVKPVEGNVKPEKETVKPGEESVKLKENIRPKEDQMCAFIMLRYTSL